MLVLMAARAVMREPEIGMVRILDLNRGALVRVDVRRVMALGAGEAYVFTIKDETCFVVIEFCRGWIPMEQAEGSPIVLRVAAHAQSFWLSHERGMEASLLRQPGSDFLVTFKTEECWRTG